MKPTHQRRRNWILVTAIVAVLAIVGSGLKVFSDHGIASQAIPERPDLSGWPTEFASVIAAAEARARGYLHSVDGLARLTRLYQANGFYHETSICLHGLTELEPRNPRWPYQLAGILAGFGRIEEALPWQYRAVELAPKNPACQLRLGDMQLKNNHRAEARQCYAATLALDPANVYAMLGLARCEMAEEKWTEARALLRSAVAQQSTFTGAWDLLATVDEHLGDSTAASEDRRRAKVGQRFREAPEPWPLDLLGECFDAYQLSVAAAVSTDKVDAQRKLERALELAPRNSGYRRLLAKQLVQEGKLSEARSHLETAVAFEPGDAEAWAELINLLVTQRDASAAQTALTTALARCPQSSYLHFLNGNRLAEQNRLGEAESEYVLAVKLQPNEARSRVQLSAIYARQGRLANAIEQIKSARAAEPANADVLILLVRLGILSGDEPGTRQWFRELLAMPQAAPREIAPLRELYRSQFGHELR